MFPQGLSAEGWAQTTNSEERLHALQQLENQLAQQDGRNPCSVQFIPESYFIDATDRQQIRGLHQPAYIDEAGIKQEEAILVNRSYVDREQPYWATETLFHESRHAYQNYAVNNPEVHHDKEQLKDWSINVQNEGYLEPEDGMPAYRWQPIEKDANEVARKKMDGFYEGQFSDYSGYAEYKSQREAQLQQDIDEAKIYFETEHYVQAARNQMYEQYNASLALEENMMLSNTEIVVAQPEAQGVSDPGQDKSLEESALREEVSETIPDLKTEREAPLQLEQEVSESNDISTKPDAGEDYDYTYGHGY